MYAIKTIIITLLCEPLPPGDDLFDRRAIYYLSEHHFRAVVYIVIFLSFVFYRPRVFTFFMPIKRLYPPHRFSASSITELGQILYSYLGTYNNNIMLVPSVQSSAVPSTSDLPIPYRQKRYRCKL